MSVPTWWLVEPFGRGGVAQYACDVARLLEPVASVRLGTSSDGPAVGHTGPVECWFPRIGPPTAARAVAAAVGLWCARRRPRPGDTVWVALGFRPRYERLLVVALRRAGCRVVATVHNRHPHEHPGAAAAVLAAARRCDVVVVHTAEMEAWARSGGLPWARLPFPPPAGGLVAAAGVHSRRSLGLAESDVVLSVVGNLRGYKGVDVLLEALGRLTDASPVQVVLAGQAQGWDVLAAADAAGARRRVRLIEGFLPHGELLDVLDLADAAALPYRRIDHSGAGALAASRGLPAVASDLPALRELFGDAAAYVAPGAVDALTDALRALPERLPVLRRNRRAATEDPALAAAYQTFARDIAGR